MVNCFIKLGIYVEIKLIICVDVDMSMVKHTFLNMFSEVHTITAHFKKLKISTENCDNARC